LLLLDIHAVFVISDLHNKRLTRQLYHPAKFYSLRFVQLAKVGLPNTVQDDVIKVIELVYRKLKRAFFMHCNQRVVMIYNRSVGNAKAKQQLKKSFHRLIWRFMLLPIILSN
jgi:UDP-2,3-diacylglucosamine pyrophosphatase LpxH